jgi:tetratricopeptide (TPR) repeat protein
MCCWFIKRLHCRTQRRSSGEGRPAVITISVDEKPGLQAIANTTPDGDAGRIGRRRAVHSARAASSGSGCHAGPIAFAFHDDGQGGSIWRAQRPSSTRAIYSESGYGHLSFGWSMLKAWRTGNYLYVDAPERELYDQTADPGAMHNLAPDSKAVADTAAAQMAEFRRKTVAESTEKTQLTAEQTENLHTLGYMGSDATALNDTNGEAGPDPKQKIAIANLLYEAMVHTENARYQEAVPIVEEVVKQEPHALTAYLLLGRAYVSLKEYQKAIPPLQHVVETMPDNSLAHYELGCALVKTGRWNDAAPQFEAAVSQMNSSAMMHFYLAMVYQQTSRNDEALAEFKDALRWDPKNFPANLLLGRMYQTTESRGCYSSFAKGRDASPGRDRPASAPG